MPTESERRYASREYLRAQRAVTNFVELHRRIFESTELIERYRELKDRERETRRHYERLFGPD